MEVVITDWKSLCRGVCLVCLSPCWFKCKFGGEEGERRRRGWRREGRFTSDPTAKVERSKSARNFNDFVESNSFVFVKCHSDQVWRHKSMHEICVNPESFLSSLLTMTRPDLVGRRWSLMRIALCSSMVHPEASLCQGKDQIAHILLSCCVHSISSPVHNCCMVAEHCCWSRSSDEHGHGEMFEGLRCKVEPDVGTTATETGMKYLTTKWEKTWTKCNNEWEYKVRFLGRENKWQEFPSSLFSLSFHVALSSRVSVWCVWLWLVCCVCVLLCVACVCGVCVLLCVVWHAEKPPCVHSERPCVYQYHAHMFDTCGRGTGTHGDVLNVHTDGVLNVYTVPQPPLPQHTHNTTTCSNTQPHNTTQHNTTQNTPHRGHNTPHLTTLPSKPKQH